MRELRDRAAVTGIGWTEFSRGTDRSVLDLAAEAGLAAIDDAGLAVEDVDGVVTFFHNQDTVRPRELVRCLGLRECNYQVASALGGGWAAAAVATAAMAVACGLCRHVLVFRAMRGASRRTPPIGWDGGEDQWRVPFGVTHAAARFGPHVTAHMAAFGTTTTDFGRVAVGQRGNARLNRKAVMRSAITLEDHQTSPWVVYPFRRLDCCLRTDGAVAVVVSPAERASGLRHAPVHIRAALGGGLGMPGRTLHSEELWWLHAHHTAGRLYDAAGIRPGDLDLAELYDPFTGLCLLHIEGFRLAAHGEAAGLVADGGTDLDGAIPVNTHGGLLSEAYTHGLGHVVEAVQQLRPGGVRDDLCDGAHDYDRARCRQVRQPELALVCGEAGESSLVLRAAP